MSRLLDEFFDALAEWECLPMACKEALQLLDEVSDNPVGLELFPGQSLMNTAPPWNKLVGKVNRDTWIGMNRCDVTIR